jgi:hypothetical protein
MDQPASASSNAWQGAICVTDLPRNPNGKILKRSCADNTPTGRKPGDHARRRR